MNGKPIILIAAAFVAGLAPGLLLYWNAARPGPTQVSPSTSAAVPAAAPTTPLPSTAVIAPPPAAAIKPPSASEKPRAATAAKHENVAILEQQLRDRNERLSTAEASLSETRSRLSDLEGRMATLTEQSTQALTNEKSLRQELENATRLIASLQTEGKARDAKSTDLDVAQQRLLKQSNEAAQKSAARTLELATELEDIARRRENYLNQILTRYREATEQFRALSLRLDNPRDGGSPLSTDLSRIQQAIQHAEEDMRQLRALNQGSTRVLKELAATRKK